MTLRTACFCSGWLATGIRASAGAGTTNGAGPGAYGCSPTPHPPRMVPPLSGGYRVLLDVGCQVPAPPVIVAFSDGVGSASSGEHVAPLRTIQGRAPSPSIRITQR